MFVSTTEKIPENEVKEFGIVKGNTIRAKWFGKDVLAEAVQRMMREAEALGADAVVNVRFASSQVARGATEILAYGTAVKLERGE